MAGRGLMNRVGELERQDGPGFGGYACVDVLEGQTIEKAKAAWIAENGPFGTLQVVLWNCAGYSPGEWRAMCAGNGGDRQCV